MRSETTVSSIWKDPEASGAYRSGVSLHSHTSASEESLSHARTFLGCLPGAHRVFAHYEERCLQRHGIRLDFKRAYWRPPLQPRMAFDLEQAQVRELQLFPLVSITDHDTIEAPMLLRTLPSARHIPVSLEWTVTFGLSELHLGIHNLPSADGPAWMRRFAAFTAAPGDAALLRMLAELDGLPGVLVVLNHPLWDLNKTGREAHTRDVIRLLGRAKRTIHALELNGLRHARENREVMQLARATGHLLISGGDRHGLEPNANINLSNARKFRDFVDEVRIERRSHVLFMTQYGDCWQQRMLHSTLNAVTDFPEFIEGWQRWDDRAFHPDAQGRMRPLRELWATGKAPLPLRTAIQVVRLSRSQALSRTFGMVFPAMSLDVRANLL